MTREEARRIIEGECYIFDPLNFDRSTMVNTALDMAIEALEQESMLDKIRAEIEHHRHKTQSIDPYDLVGDCLDIIDKHKTGSEEK